MRTASTTRILTVTVPPVLAARRIRSWAVIEEDGTATICLDATYSPTEAAAATLRVLACGGCVVPAPRMPAA